MSENTIIELQTSIKELKSLLLQKTDNTTICPEWVSKAQVMNFLDYGETQMGSLINSGELVTTKIGRRLFISKTSLQKLLDRNSQK